MAIAPINSVSFKSNYNNKIHFTANNRDEENDNTSPEGYPFPRRAARNLATVPVVVMMTMSPSLLNAATAPEKSVPLNAQALTELVEAQESPKTEVSAYVMAPQQAGVMSQGQRTYFESNKDIIPFKMYAGSGAYIAFSDPLKKREIMYVEYVPKDFKYTNMYDAVNLPVVKEMVYHKTGDSREYCGLILRNSVEINGQSYFKDTEQRITDDAANAIIDLLNGDSKFTDNTGLMVRIVDTPNLTPTKMVKPTNSDY